ncbi:MAG: leucine-rich repeat domain-containing protein, partial [Oscillospiraceae bacterium]|nr:leucine-rich repeat domain-containing protein [Oscillospiraceae bacterium]
AALCAAIPLMQAQAADNEVHQSGPYTYTFYDYGYDVETDNTVSIDACDFTQLTGDTLTIPERLDGYRVKQLNGQLFAGQNYKKVVLPDSISFIGWECFKNCTGLEEVEIYRSDARPDTEQDRGRHRLLSFNGYAFAGCTNLNKITFSDRIGFISYDVFKDCTSLTTIELPAALEEISTEMFLGCTSLNEITIPDSVTAIGKDAFSGCTGLTEIDLPESVKTIEVGAFADCSSLRKITIRSKGCIIKEKKFTSDKDAISQPTVICGKRKSGAEYYAKRHGLNFIPLDGEDPDPEEYLTFSYNEYDDNYNVSGYDADKMPAMIEIPAMHAGKPVVRVGLRAFYGCTTLCSVEVSEGIKAINASAFAYSYLYEIKLPDSLREIYSGAFYQCSNLWRINLPEGPTCLYGNTFEGCGSLEELTVPRSVERIKEKCFYYCGKLRLKVLNPYCSFDDNAEVCTLVSSITAAEDSGAHAYAVKYNKEFISTGEVTPVTYRSQSVGYLFRIVSMIRADIPGTLYADPDAYCELKIGSKRYTKPVANSMQYYESSQSISSTSALHRYFEIPIDPADAMKEGTLRLCRGDGTVVKSVTVRGTDVTETGLKNRVYDYFEAVLEQLDPEDADYRRAKTAMDFCAATALYFNPDAGYTVSDDVKNLDQNVYKNITPRFSGTKPENLELEFSTVFRTDPFMRLYIRFTDDSYDSHTYKKGASRQRDTELLMNSRGERYLDSETDQRDNLNSQYSFVIDSFKVGITPLYYAKLLAETGDERKVTLGNAMYLYAKR